MVGQPRNVFIVEDSYTDLRPKGKKAVRIVDELCCFGMDYLYPLLREGALATTRQSITSSPRLLRQPNGFLAMTILFLK